MPEGPEQAKYRVPYAKRSRRVVRSSSLVVKLLVLNALSAPVLLGITFAKHVNRYPSEQTSFVPLLISASIYTTVIIWGALEVDLKLREDPIATFGCIYPFLLAAATIPLIFVIERYTTLDPDSVIFPGGLATILSFMATFLPASEDLAEPRPKEDY